MKGKMEKVSIHTSHIVKLVITITEHKHEPHGFTIILGYLYSDTSTYNFASPVIRIWIKNELWIIREGEIKDEEKYKDGDGRQPLQPANTSASLMVWCEAKED